MAVSEILAELKALGTESTVKTFRRHGANGDLYGVKIADLKKVLKKIKGDQALALDLWKTGNSDAMYLAALAADGSQMTPAQLNAWAKSAWWYMLSEYAVPFVAAEHPQACSIAAKWIDARAASVASSGWATFALIVSTRPDSELELDEIMDLLHRVQTGIASAENRVRYCMNNFVIAVGAYVKPLLKEAKAVAKKIGQVEVDVGDTSCRVPIATDAIRKIESLGRIGQKRKSTKC